MRVIKQGGEGHATTRLKGRWTGPAATCSRRTSGKSTVTLAPLQWRSHRKLKRRIQGNVGSHKFKIILKKQKTPDLD